ncbi:hypothetical protein C8J57DRAFT_1565881 [Mycena rebaudengoi]|nr:hypothetical protein C8J57DRAFT_1565881 [Mycena rebaudengoi]
MCTSLHPSLTPCTPRTSRERSEGFAPASAHASSWAVTSPAPRTPGRSPRRTRATTPGRTTYVCTRMPPLPDPRHQRDRRPCADALCSKRLFARLHARRCRPPKCLRADPLPVPARGPTPHDGGGAKYGGGDEDSMTRRAPPRGGDCVPCDASPPPPSPNRGTSLAAASRSRCRAGARSPPHHNLLSPPRPLTHLNARRLREPYYLFFDAPSHAVHQGKAARRAPRLRALFFAPDARTYILVCTRLCGNPHRPAPSHQKETAPRRLRSFSH